MADVKTAQCFELYRAESGNSDSDSERTQVNGHLSDIQRSVLRTANRLKVSFFHGSVLAAISCLGVLFSWLFRELTNPVVGSSSVFVVILSENMTATVIGFGFSIYGCLVNRQLQRQLQQHTEMGPYTMRELIGSGGMGDVYLAEHRLLKRLCAVKLLRRDKAGSRHMMQCFEREVEAMARLTHWNTVQIFDYGRTQTGAFYYAMEYLKGLNLRQLVEQFGPLPPGRVVFILRQICGSLHEAAQHGLVHRDIKPSNIFLAERGRMYDVAKLLDFGLVCPTCEDGLEMRTVSCTLQGSPRYMCPEQARGLNPDCRGDLYSLGCVAYFLLTGRPPFDEQNPVLLVVAHGTTPVPTFREIGADVPDDLAAVILKCLEKNPDNRHVSPRALLGALDKCGCAHDWTWHDAEAWWHQHEEAVTVTESEAIVSGADARTPADSVCTSEPDPTFVCELPYTA